MTSKVLRSARREQPLSKAQIIATAIEILDTDGEDALTFRALAARLATGSGAIYWHVADKEELLAATADHVVTQALTGLGESSDPRAAIRAIAFAVYEAFDTHPWLGAHLNREPWRPGLLRVFEGFGAGVQALGVAEAAKFGAWSALVNYVLGTAAQKAANARILGRADRSAFLDDVAARWERLDPAQHPFVRQLATRLRGHDDRDQFVAGIDLILAGIDRLR